MSRHLISLGGCRKERFLNIGKVLLNKTPGPGGRMEGGMENRELRGLLCTVRGLLMVGASPVAEHSLSARGLQQVAVVDGGPSTAQAQ